MKKQTGSSSVIIIIVLIVALIAVLGYVLWKNISTPDSTSQQDNSSTPQSKSASVENILTVVDNNNYSLTVPNGFKEVGQQQYTYSASLKMEKSFTNDNGDYFEILSPHGGGGGFSSDYHWSYKLLENGNVSLVKGEICNGDEIGCSSDNSSLEGVVSNEAGETEYFLAFGNRTKKATDLTYVDDFTATLRFK